MNDQSTAEAATAAVDRQRPLFRASDPLRSLIMTRDDLEEHLIVGFNSRDRRSRPYHLLRSQLLKIMARNDWRMIGITSATPAAGKTFTSVNIAAAVAATAPAPVVLCDLDLRRGSLREMLPDDDGPGLGAYLTGDVANPADLLFRVNDTQLVAVPTDPGRESSSELIASARFRSFMGRLRALPEDVKVICDLPPVFANDDAMMCMQYLDAYMLVVDHGMSTARQIEEAVRLLDPLPCLGTVLNRYQGGFADPYGYGYGDTYGMKNYG